MTRYILLESLTAIALLIRNKKIAENLCGKEKFS